MQQFDPDAKQEQRSNDLSVLLPDLDHAIGEVGDMAGLQLAWRQGDPGDRIAARALEGAFLGVMNHLAALSFWALVAHGFRTRHTRDNLPEAFKEVAQQGVYPLDRAGQLALAQGRRNRLSHDRHLVAPKQVWVAAGFASDYAAEYHDAVIEWAEPGAGPTLLQ